MSASLWSQVDAGVALTLGAIVETAAVRKLQRPRVFALSLQRLDPALAHRRSLSLRIALAVAVYEAVVGVGVNAFRGVAGFVFTSALLITCVGFLLALARAVQQSVPCACFGRLGRTAAGGREIGRGIVLVAGAAFLVVQRALDTHAGYGFGPPAGVAIVATAGLIVVAQRVGAMVRPGVEVPVAGPQASGSWAGWLRGWLRGIAGYDNDLYSSTS